MNITQAMDLIAAETEVMMANRYAKHSYIDNLYGLNLDGIRDLRGSDNKTEDGGRIMIRVAAAFVLAVIIVGSVISSDMEHCLENNRKDVCASALMR